MKTRNHQPTTTRPQLRKELSKRMRMKTKNSKKVSVVQLFKKNLILNGMMSLDSSLPKKVSKKQSLCLLSSQNCSRVAESHGKVFYFMDHQVLARVSLLKLVLPSVIAHSFQFLLQIWLASGRVSPKSLLKTCSKWQEI